MTMTTGCSCGCSEMTTVTAAQEPCGCGCECCGDAAKSRDDEIAELRNLRAAIDTRLSELSGDVAAAS